MCCDEKRLCSSEHVQNLNLPPPGLNLRFAKQSEAFTHCVFRTPN